MMNTDIKAEIKPLKRILGDRDFYYQIPDYQRPYAWDKDHVEDLIDNLIDAFENGGDTNYFCGSLVIVENKVAGRYDVIDGQQRLTTFTIFSCVMRDFFSLQSEEAKDFILESIKDKYEKKGEKLLFLTDEKHRNAFRQTVLEEGSIEKHADKRKDKSNKYLRNAYIILDFLEKKFKEYAQERIDAFIVWVFEKVVLTHIICPSEDTAIRIFNVLNTTGLPLSSADIVKSKLMQKLSEGNFDQEDRKSFVEDWKQIDTRVQANGAELTSLLQAYLFYRTASNPEHTLDKELVKSIRADETPLSFIHELKEFSESYVEALNEEDKYIYCLRYLRHQIYWPSILAIAKYKKAPYYEQLKAALVGFYYQTWIGGGTTGRIKHASFSIMRSIKTDESIDDISSIIENNLTDANRTTESYRAAIRSEGVYDASWRTPVLCLLEYFYKDDSNQSFLESGGKNMHVEHILPQNPKEADWRHITPEERERYTNSLGNLTLLSGRKNVQASNASFDKKKEVYKNRDGEATSYELTRRLFEEHNAWTAKDIEARRDALIQKLDEVLGVK